LQSCPRRAPVDMAGRCMSIIPHTTGMPLTEGGRMTAVLGYFRQWLWYSWYTGGVGFFTPCLVTTGQDVWQGMVAPQEALLIWRSLKPRWSTEKASIGSSRRMKCFQNT